MNKHRRDFLKALVPAAGAGAVSTVAQALLASQVPQARRKGQAKGAAAPATGRFGPDFIDPMVRAWKDKHGIVGASLAIAKDGRLVHAMGYGYSNLEEQQPVSPSTLFSTASVAKTITAVAALTLMDQGKLDLDARIVDVLADINPQGRPADPDFARITTRQLLHHAAGVPDRFPKAMREKDDGSPTTIYHAAYRRKLDFPPGTDHRYSNSGYVIARLPVEKASGMGFEEYVVKRVLAPLGITRMLMERSKPVDGETLRYVLTPNGTRIAPHNTANWLTTPTDMLRFLTAVSGTRRSKLLSNEARAQMLAPPPPPIKSNRNGGHVGLGWDLVRNADGDRQYHKNGGKPGVRAHLEHLPGGIDWCLMYNTGESESLEKEEKGDSTSTEAYRELAEALLARRRWPAVDLFESV